MALTIPQVLRKLKKHQELAQKTIITFAPYEYRIFAERKRLSPAHLDDVNDQAEREGFFLYQGVHGTLFFGREEHCQPDLFDTLTDIDNGLAL